MRISDWSSDVCSSDHAGQRTGRHITLVPQPQLSQILLGALIGDLRRDTVVTGLGHNDVEGLFELVEIELLGDHADAALESGGFTVQIMTEEIGRASCRERVCQYG